MSHTLKLFLSNLIILWLVFFSPTLLANSVSSFNGNHPVSISHAQADLNGDSTPESALLAHQIGDGNGWRAQLVAGIPGQFDLQPVQLLIDSGYSNFKAAEGDFDGDGLTDVLAYKIGTNEGWRARVATAKEDGTFTLLNYQNIIATSYGTGWSQTTGDFDGDGSTDILAYKIGSNEGWRARLATSDNDGSFTLMNYQNIAATGYNSGWSQVTGDFDGDGLVDIAAFKVGTNEGWHVRAATSDGDGSFTLHPYLVLVSSGFNAGWKLSAGDFNGDGLTDLLAYKIGTNEGWRAQLAVSDGDGTFTVKNYQNIIANGYDSGWAQTVGDFDNDGNQMSDILAYKIGTDEGWRARLATSDGDGSFTLLTYRIITADGFGSEWVQVTGDVNTDSKSDIVAARFDGVDGWITKTATSYGDGTFQILDQELLRPDCPDLPTAAPQATSGLSPPSYLSSVTDPAYLTNGSAGTTTIRVTDDKGNSIFSENSTVLGQWNWRPRTVYSDHQAWNADGSVLFLHFQSLFLDGETYEPIKIQYPPGTGFYQWSPVDPTVMITLNNNEVLYWDWENDVLSSVMTVAGYSNLIIGTRTNMSYDGQFVGVKATRDSDGGNVCIVLDLINKSTSSVIPFSDYGFLAEGAKEQRCSATPSGEYIYIDGVIDSDGDGDVDNDDSGAINSNTGIFFDWNGNKVGWFPDNSFVDCPGHGDLALDRNGEDVFVGRCDGGGKSWSSSYVGNTLALRVAGAVQGEAPDARLRIVSKVAYSHISCRSTARPGWCYGSSFNSSGSEIVAIRLDGNRNEHIANTQSDSNYDDFSYWVQPQAVPSPDGKKIVFAGNWNNQIQPTCVDGNLKCAQSFVVDVTSQCSSASY